MNDQLTMRILRKKREIFFDIIVGIFLLLAPQKSIFLLIDGALLATDKNVSCKFLDFFSGYFFFFLTCIEVEFVYIPNSGQMIFF